MAFVTVMPNLEGLIISRRPFCVAQIPFYLREFSQYIAETGTPLEIQNDRRKYSRFGPGQPLMRAFRTVHTKKSVISGHLAIDQTKPDFNFDLNETEFAYMTGDSDSDSDSEF